jgi:hypothetical protein
MRNYTARQTAASLSTPPTPRDFNEETLQAIREAEERSNLSGPFESVEAMFEAMEN